MEFKWGELKKNNPELAEQVALSVGNGSVEAVPFDDDEVIDLDYTEEQDITTPAPAAKESMFHTLLNLIEDEDEDTDADSPRFAPSAAENAEWLKRFGVTAKKTGNVNEAGPEYDVTGPKEALQRLWTNYEAQSFPDFNPDKDYGISDNQWWADQIKEIDANGDGDTDVTVTDANGNGAPDTAIVTAGSDKERRAAVKAAKDELDIDEQTSTGKTKKELKADTLSDERQKNVLTALLDHRF